LLQKIDEVSKKVKTATVNLARDDRRAAEEPLQYVTIATAKTILQENVQINHSSSTDQHTRINTNKRIDIHQTRTHTPFQNHLNYKGPNQMAGEVPVEEHGQCKQKKDEQVIRRRKPESNRLYIKGSIEGTNLTFTADTGATKIII